jgi:hypothetical protein
MEGDDTESQWAKVAEITLFRPLGFENGFPVFFLGNGDHLKRIITGLLSIVNCKVPWVLALDRCGHEAPRPISCGTGAVSGSKDCD